MHLVIVTQTELRQNPAVVCETSGHYSSSIIQDLAQFISTYVAQTSALCIGCEPFIIPKNVCKICCADYDKESIVRAQKSAASKKITFIHDDILQLPFRAACFGATYSFLVGSLLSCDRGALIKEMVRLTVPEGKIITFAWNNNNATTAFLEEYFPAQDKQIIAIDDSVVVTNKGIVERVSADELLLYFKNARCKDIEVFECQLWRAVIGTK